MNEDDEDVCSVEHGAFPDRDVTFGGCNFSDVLYGAFEKSCASYLQAPGFP